jgi:hypothetical protein
MVLHPPAALLHVEPDFSAEKYKVICEGSHDHAPVHPGAEDEAQCVGDPLQQGEPLNLHRQDKHDVHHEIRVQPGERQKDSAIQKAAVRRLVQPGSEVRNESHCYRYNVSNQKENVVSKGSPIRF